MGSSTVEIKGNRKTKAHRHITNEESSVRNERATKREGRRVSAAFQEIGSGMGENLR